MEDLRQKVVLIDASSKIYMCVFKAQHCDMIPNVLYVYFLVKVSDLHILLVNNIIL